MHLDPDTVVAYVEGTLAPDVLVRADSHIDTCASCRGMIAARRLAMEATRSDTVAAGDATMPAARARTGGGQLSSRYDVVGRLGAGGMGEILLASDRQIGREVAIKRVLATMSKAAEARFLREARIQGQLDHPAIVPVHELADDSDGRPFFAMKKLSGTTLAEVIKRGTLSRQKLLRAFADVCLAIEFAHSRGIIHRDLKPANIMLGDFGEVYVLDWGIARVLAESEDTALPASPRSSDPALTEVGAVLGTLGYMAPEQLAGRPIDPRADVYALGCILFELLAGQPLWLRPTRSTTFEDLDARPAQRAPDREIPPELDAVCVEATRFDRDARMNSARALADRIERFLDGDRDIALRKQLASQHVTAARSALAAGDGETERATAMREAGRALALDPAGGDAAELVGRLMLEPPRVVPRDVDVRVATLEEEAARSRMMLNAITVFCFLAFVPVIAYIGIRHTWAVGLYSAAALLDGFVMMLVVRKAGPVSARDLYVSMAIHTILMTMIARLFSPFWLAPALAVVSTMTFAVDPRIRWRPIAGLMIAAVLAPWLLEILGLWPRTLSVLDGNLVVHSDIVTMRLPQIEIGLVSYVVILVAIMGFVSHRLGATNRAALRAVELQAWHLRQLVPAKPV